MGAGHGHDERATAARCWRQLGLLSADATTITDFLGTSDETDVFQFRVRGDNQTVTLRLDQLTASANITAKILEDDGRVVTTRSLDASSSTLFATLATSGTYYVQLNAAGTDTSYRMSLSTSATTTVTAASVGGSSTMSFIGGSSGADTLTATAARQTLTGGAGADTLVGFNGFDTTFKDTVAGRNGDTIRLFGGSDVIDLTDLAFASLKPFAYSGTSSAGSLTVADATHARTISFTGNFSVANFVAVTDRHGGTLISFH
ncbi:MAG: hypothetical protein ACJ8AW_33710 [Rhodopila sp.]